MTPTLTNQLDRSWADRLTPALNRLIADFDVLRFNVRSCLWNGWGEQYPSMTEMLPAFKDHAEQGANLLGRRVRCLEGCPPSSMTESLELSSIPATDGALHQRACAKMLREALTRLLQQEREVLAVAQHAGDEVTAREITTLIQFQEEALWMLRSSLRRTAFETQYLSGDSA